MTDVTPSYDPAAAWAAIEAQHAARTRLADEVRPANKTALLDALAAAGISSVVVTFDGSGDSGQIEGVDARIGDTATELPATAVEITSPLWEGAGLETRTLPLAEAIEQLAYDLLEETHDGWENNDGAFGEFTFDVAEGVIRLDHNERFETSEYSGHEW